MFLLSMLSLGERQLEQNPYDIIFILIFLSVIKLNFLLPPASLIIFLILTGLGRHLYLFHRTLFSLFSATAPPWLLGSALEVSEMP